MNYSLGNMLGGAGALNADKLSLDLQFAADKTLTARKGPTPTFTRASGATFVNNFGQIRYGRENLALRSEDFSATEWNAGSARTLVVTANDTTSPSGATDADRLAVTNTTTFFTIAQSAPTLSVGTIYTMSCHLKANQVTRVQLYSSNTTTLPASAIFDLTGDGSVVQTNFGTAAITKLDNGWFRCEVTGTVTNTTAISLRIAPINGTSTTYPGNGVDSFWAWGYQFQRHDFATIYIPTTTSVVYGPRFDHDPVTFESKGLLIEESRTNSLQHSANFKNTTSSNYWENQSTTSVTVDQTTSPDGGVNADLLTTSTASFDCYARRNNNYTGLTQYTYSIFVKQGPSGHRYVGIYIGVGISALQFPFFDFNNPTVVQIPSGTMVGTINSTRVDAYSNGWYRVSVTFTTPSTPVTQYAGVYISTSNGTLPASSTAGLDAYIWGAQLELGAFPTSYIPTTTASVVRSADVCSITGSAFTSFYNQSEGTVLTDSIPAAVAGTVTIFSLSNGTANERWLNRFAQNEQVVVTSAGTESGLDAINPVAGQRYKVLAAGKVNDFAMSINGLAAITDTSQPMPVVDRAGIGSTTAVTSSGAMTIASIRYYKKRLSNAKIQALSTV